MVCATEDDFKQAAGPMLQRAGTSDFNYLFGTTPACCARVWNRVNLDDLPDAEMQHLLWFLLYLKINPSETTLWYIADASRNTFRQWCFEMQSRTMKVFGYSQSVLNADVIH